MRKQELHYLAIGDSLTVGYGAPIEYSFVNRYRELAEQALDRKIILHQAGKNGATAEDTLFTVRQDPEIRLLIRNADLITITAGGNNLIQAAKSYFVDRETKVLKTALVQYGHHMRQLVSEIRRLKVNKRRLCAIRMLGIYNPLPHFHEAVFWVQRFNAHLERLEKDPFRMVNIYDAFLGQEEELLSDDQYHPNSEGYRLLAEQTHLLGYGPLQERTPR
ncbi:MAG: spore germination lipase LipC [Paenibacillus sp.]|nr:spore germination lipase LipC [Paenibacillus sp.]